MEKLVIKRTVWLQILLLVCSSAFVLGGVFILARSPEKWVGWMSIVFFGACSLVCVWQIFDSRPRLTVDDEGVLDRTLGVGIVRWEDIEGAYKRSIASNDFICLRLRNTADYLARLSKVKQAMTSANEALGFTPLSINLSGIHGMTDQVLELILKKSEQAKTRRT